MVNKKYQEEIIALLQGGYSISSISKVMSKKYKTEIKNSDILILARQRNIRVGNKDLEKLSTKDISKALPYAVKDENLVNSVKNKLIILLICFIALLGAIYLIGGFKPMLITLGVVLTVLILALIVVYFKFIKGNADISSFIRKRK